MAKFYKGRFSPRNPQKYKGDPTNIIYRSGWELRVMKFFDDNEAILEWCSEEFFIPYRSPLDNKIHRYFPDFKIKIRERDGKISTRVIEIKPEAQSRPPEVKAKPNKKYITEVARWGINSSKWAAAKEYCENHGWSFHVLTERDIFGK